MTDVIMDFSLMCDELEVPKRIGCCRYPLDYSEDRIASLIQMLSARAYKYAKDRHVTYSVNTDTNALSFVVNFIPEPVDPTKDVGPAGRANKITTGMMNYLFNLLHFEYMDYKGVS